MQFLVRKAVTWSMLIAGLMIIAFPLSASAQGPGSVANLAERLLPAVVNISTKQNIKGKHSVPIPNLPDDSPFRDFFEDFFDKQKPQKKESPKRRRLSSLGSGFVIDPEGIVITNNHVVKDADEIEVIFTDGTRLQATIVGRDKKTDIAVLKIKPEKPLAYVKIGDSDKLRVGDWVMAIGNPFGLGGSVSLGIVSAHHRDINSGPYDDFIQTDAAINKGNSGGPLFNMEGEVVGINTAIISPSGGSIGIGFSIPSSTASRVISQLREFGETRRGWLGVRIQTVTKDIAESLGMDEAKGALVADITETGPAEKSGMKAGDVIVEFDGRPVVKMSDLPKIVARTEIGKEVTVKVIRSGNPVDIQVVLGRLEDGEKLVAKNGKGKAEQDSKLETTSVLGMELSVIDKALRKKFKIKKGVNGVVVTAVDPDSRAGEKRIAVGDVIAEAGEIEVRKPEDIVGRVKELKEEGRGSILLLVLKTSRGGSPHFIALKIKD